LKKLHIEPGKSIGVVKLGMSKDEIELLTKNDSVFYMVEYDIEDRCKFIQIASSTKESYVCEYSDIDLFNTKVSDLVTLLDNISPYDRNHFEVGYTYIFPKLGLSLWRPQNISEDIIHEQWFKEMSIENQQDELKHLYFESVSVFNVKT